MKSFFPLILSLFSFWPDLKAQNFSETIQFANVEIGRNLILTEDEYTDRWSSFDVASKMQGASSKDEYLKFASEQVREWTPAEIKIIKSVLKKVDKSISKYDLKLNLPDSIYFVKTTMKEESGAAAYTRMNYAVLSESFLEASKKEYSHVLVHELFHILSRHDAELRKKMYEIIGFTMMEEIEYPDSLKELRLTNPDAPLIDSYITLQVKQEKLDCAMILYAKGPYTGGSFFEYLTIGFIRLDEQKKVFYKGSEAEIYSFQDIRGFYEQIGTNTKYIIQPEEIMADNFSFAIWNKKKLPNPEIQEKIRSRLSN